MYVIEDLVADVVGMVGGSPHSVNLGNVLADWQRAVLLGPGVAEVAMEPSISRRREPPPPQLSFIYCERNACALGKQGKLW